MMIHRNKQTRIERRCENLQKQNRIKRKQASKQTNKLASKDEIHTIRIEKTMEFRKPFPRRSITIVVQCSRKSCCSTMDGFNRVV